MPIEVYDFHNSDDHTHVLVTPQIRARLLRIEPSEAPVPVASRAGFHTHDLGHEIFLILQGRCLMQIEDEAVELGPGQLCYARLDQPHRAGVIGNEPVVMYLSVTPHIRPTHTQLDEEWNRQPANYGAPNSFDGDTDTETPLAELAARYAEAAVKTAEAAAVEAERAARFSEVVAAAVATTGDAAALEAARSEAWGDLYRTFTAVHELGGLWNDVAARTTQALEEA